MLAPYRVLDLADERGQLAGQILADLGADVILVEPPEGSPARRLGPFYHGQPSPNGSLHFWSMNRNKRGITLDLASQAGRTRLLELAATADLVIESFEPGYLDSIGLGYTALSEANPRLVLVSITPFGQAGPKAQWAATDLTVNAASGVMLVSGDADRPPVRLPKGQAWLHAAAEAAAGALIALAGRERDGLGQHVDVSAQTATAQATQSFILSSGWGDVPLHRVAGGIKLGPLTLRLVYPCADGYVSNTFLFGSAIGPFTRRQMEVMAELGFVDAATRDKDWVNYVELLLSGREPLSELQRVMDAVEAFTRSKTKAELFDLAMQRGLLIVPVSTTEDIHASEQLASRDYWQSLEHRELDASVPYPGPLARFSATPITYRRRPPLLGEHNEDVSREPRAGSRPKTAAPFRRPDPGSGLPGPPLAGLKVLDFTWVWVGPMAIRYLADYGATVVHVESSTRIDTARTGQPFKDRTPGAERSAFYANVNAGKLGLTLNMKLPEARAVALRLARWADVVAENYSPKAMRAFGLDYATLRDANPSLIMLSSSLNGQSGPHAMLAGYGTMGSALTGFSELHGWPDSLPLGAGAYTDYVSSKLIAAAILAALDHRRRTGEGQYIDLAQAEASLHFLGPALLDYAVNGHVAGRAGNDDPDHAPHAVFPCAGDDPGAPGTGRWVAIACADDQQWQALCRATGHDEWADDRRFARFEDRRVNREALEALIAAWTVEHEADAIEERLQAAGVPVHRASSSADCFADPQLIVRGHFPLVEHAELGPVPVESSRMRFSRTPSHVAWSGPTFGQHNDQVLREILGMSDDEITDLIVAGALE